MINWLIFEFNDKRELLSANHCVCDLAIQFASVPVSLSFFNFNASSNSSRVGPGSVSVSCCLVAFAFRFLFQLLLRLVSCEICKFFSTLDAWYKQNFCTDNDIFIVRWRACQPLGPPTWDMSYCASMLRFALLSSWKLKLRLPTPGTGRNCCQC